MDERDKHLKIRELEVLDQELSTLKQGATVYKRTGNTSLFFLAERAAVHSETKRALAKLKNSKPSSH